MCNYGEITNVEFRINEHNNEKLSSFNIIKRFIFGFTAGHNMDCILTRKTQINSYSTVILVKLIVVKVIK
jgi:hypothetical protein